MFTLTKEHANIIKQVCNSAANRHANQSFECVLIEASENAVTLTAGDGVVQVQRTISTEVTSNFSVAVNAQKFNQAFNSCRNPSVTLKDQLIVKSGRRIFKLHAIDADVYPAFPESVGDKKLCIDPLTIIDSIKSVSFSAAKNDVRYMLNGVYIGKHAVGTNGHRLCCVELGIESSAILSIEAVSKIPDDIKGDAFLSENVFSIIDDGYSFKCKLIQGKYVSYERAIPSKFNHTVTVNRDDFIDAVKAAKINAPDTGNVLFSFGPESKITSRSSKNEDASIGFDCDADGEFEMGFNSSYLLDALNAIHSDSVLIQFTDSQACIINDLSVNVISMARF